MGKQRIIENSEIELLNQCFEFANYEKSYDTFEDVYFDNDGIYSSEHRERKIYDRSRVRRANFAPHSSYYEKSMQITNSSEVFDEVFIINYFHGTHWGHFLTETLARFYSIIVEKDLPCPLVMINVPFNKHKDISANTENLRYRLLLPFVKKINRDARIRINFNKRFYAKKLYLPRPTMYNMFGMYPEHIQTVREFAAPKRKPHNGRKYKKVYVTRTNWAKIKWNYRTYEGERYIEEELKTLGWTILKPEDLHIGSQINVIENSEIIAGCLGSFFHNYMMCDKFPKLSVYLTSSPRLIEPTQYVQDKVMGCYDSMYYNCFDDVENFPYQKRLLIGKREASSVVKFLESL